MFFQLFPSAWKDKKLSILILVQVDSLCFGHKMQKAIYETLLLFTEKQPKI